MITLAAAYRLTALYQDRAWTDAGGLVSYGPDFSDLYRRAAVYVDKIFKGERAADLPIEQPSKFDFIINLKTARDFGLTFPPSLLALTTEVIE